MLLVQSQNQARVFCADWWLLAEHGVFFKLFSNVSPPSCFWGEDSDIIFPFASDTSLLPTFNIFFITRSKHLEWHRPLLDFFFTFYMLGACSLQLSRMNTFQTWFIQMSSVPNPPPALHTHTHTFGGLVLSHSSLAIWYFYKYSCSALLRNTVKFIEKYIHCLALDKTCC